MIPTTIAEDRIAAYTGGYLYLSGCDLTGMTLPTSVDGSLYVSGCNLRGVTLPASVGGELDLRGSDLTGVTLPTSVGGNLDLRGWCNLTGMTLPASVGGRLYLGRCSLTGVKLPASIGGKRCTMIAYCGEYALFANEDGTYSAGCQWDLTREQALAHWSRTDARAVLFTAAINNYKE